MEKKLKELEKFHFVVHEHNARHWHHDLRLEVDGVLKSWAIPKGMELNEKEKRLGIMVEDHDLKYLSFEGIIPKGEYGSGTIKIWDKGLYEMSCESKEKNSKVEQEKKIKEALSEGKIKIEFFGNKLKGLFEMIRLKNNRNWLIFHVKS
ncbi:MAG: DNA polymerase ligase N-terminal domain-containing protein [Bacteroidota bacterium]